MQQEAVDLIGANEKRLNALSTHIVETEKAQISKVRNFQRQAQEALNSGDAEGAKTLATKAKLLLDDLVK
jgi:ribosomal protein S20